MEEICSACLTGGRKLCSLNETNYYYIYTQILEEISVWSGAGGVRVCWECARVLRRWARFKADVQRAAVLLMQHDLTPRPPPQSLSRLQRRALYSYSYCGDERGGEWGGEEDCGDHFDVSVHSVKCESPGRDDEMPVTFAHELSPARDDVTPHDDTTHTRKAKKAKTKPKKHKSAKKNLKDPIAYEDDIDILKIEKTETENINIDDSNISVSDITQLIPVPNIPVSEITGSEIPVSEIPSSNITVPETETKFECNECGVKLKTRNNLEEHLRQHANKSAHEQKVESSDKPQCDICNKQFSSRKTYKYHMNTLHGGGGSHECAECGRRYLWRSNLARHTRTHKAGAAGELHCGACDKSFASVATLRTHLALSSRHIADHDKPLVCAECGARFVNKTRLRDHVDWEHLHKIKFRCSLCDKPFKSHTSMYIHVNNVHRNKGRKDHLCHICGKAYQNVCKLRSHVAASHGAAPAHRCPCGAAFTWHSSYYRHHRHCASKSPSKKADKKPPSKLADDAVPPTY